MLPLVVALSIGVVACGRGGAPTQVATEGTSAPSSSVPAPVAEPAASTSTTIAGGDVGPTGPTTTTTPAPDRSGSDPGPSPVDGLDAEQLRSAVEAPVGASTRSVAGATADQVTLSDGTRVWRVRVPGDFTARSARVTISVGDRVVGQGVLTRDLRSLVAVTTDGSGLSAGQAVSYQWEGSPAIAAGPLAVVR